MTASSRTVGRGSWPPDDPSRPPVGEAEDAREASAPEAVLCSYASRAARSAVVEPSARPARPRTGCATSRSGANAPYCPPSMLGGDRSRRSQNSSAASGPPGHDLPPCRDGRDLDQQLGVELRAVEQLGHGRDRLLGCAAEQLEPGGRGQDGVAPGFVRHRCRAARSSTARRRVAATEDEVEHVAPAQRGSARARSSLDGVLAPVRRRARRPPRRGRVRAWRRRARGGRRTRPSPPNGRPGQPLGQREVLAARSPGGRRSTNRRESASSPAPSRHVARRSRSPPRRAPVACSRSASRRQIDSRPSTAACSPGPPRRTAGGTTRRDAAVARHGVEQASTLDRLAVGGVGEGVEERPSSGSACATISSTARSAGAQLAEPSVDQLGQPGRGDVRTRASATRRCACGQCAGGDAAEHELAQVQHVAPAGLPEPVHGRPVDVASSTARSPARRARPRRATATRCARRGPSFHRLTMASGAGSLLLTVTTTKQVAGFGQVAHQRSGGGIEEVGVIDAQHERPVHRSTGDRLTGDPQQVDRSGRAQARPAGDGRTPRTGSSPPTASPAPTPSPGPRPGPRRSSPASRVLPTPAAPASTTPGEPGRSSARSTSSSSSARPTSGHSSSTARCYVACLRAEQVRSGGLNGSSVASDAAAAVEVVDEPPSTSSSRASSWLSQTRLRRGSGGRPSDLPDRLVQRHRRRRQAAPGVVVTRRRSRSGGRRPARRSAARWRGSGGTS